ncbi:MAG: radical SAM protein [Deltaproteobacteria bacterium]|nr:radical SAM protein [Deltaproteobacteria bacterium]
MPELRPPNRALWEITWRCDLRCDHCLVDGGEPDKGELDTAEALDLVDQIAELGVPIVSLTGGEPLLRADWRQIAGRVRERAMILRFAANGHLVKGAVLDELVELGTEAFAVSVDGLQATHDAMRHGPRGSERSSFERVIGALDRLRPTPIASHVITSVTRQNLDELPAIHELLKDHGVVHWIVQLAHRTGRLAATGDDDSGGPEPIRLEDLPRVAAFIVEHSDDPLLQPAAFNSVGYLSKQEPILRASGRPRRRLPVWRGCHCGVSTIGIEPDGGVKGCANQVGAPFVVGNVRTEPLRTIFEDRARWHWLNPALEAMRGECAGCALAVVCHAGCTTLALSSSGELFDQPYCLRASERRGSGER